MYGTYTMLQKVVEAPCTFILAFEELTNVC